MNDVPFSCRCGAVKGTLHGVTPHTGTHLKCFCKFCRAAEIFCGADDPGASGVGLFQTTPDKVTFESGQDKLAAFSFGKRNVLRWQASCCGAALFNTLRNPQISFATVVTDRLQNTSAIGSAKAEAFVPQPNGTSKHTNGSAVFARLALRAITARVTGRWKETPFFDLATGKPVGPPVRVIGRKDRADLLKGK